MGVTHRCYFGVSAPPWTLQPEARHVRRRAAQPDVFSTLPANEDTFVPALPTTASALTVAVWVRLPLAARPGLQVLLANRNSDCAAVRGFALLLNANDGSVVVRWGSDQRGCVDLSTLSSGVLLAPGQWVNVAVTISEPANADTEVSISIDGKLHHCCHVVSSICC